MTEDPRIARWWEPRFVGSDGHVHCFGTAGEPRSAARAEVLNELSTMLRGSIGRALHHADRFARSSRTGSIMTVRAVTDALPTCLLCVSGRFYA